MEAYDFVLLLAGAGLIGSLIGRVAMPRLVRDHTVRRRIYPKLNWATGITFAVLVGALISQAFAAGGLPPEIKLVGIATTVVLLIAAFGFGEDERTTQP